MFPIRIDHEGLRTWTDKPWSFVPPPRLCRTEEQAIPRIPGYQQVTIQGETFEVPPTADLPGWIQHLWPSFLANAQVWRRGEDPTAYCRTWFLDDERIHRWHSWRELRLDPYNDYWQDKILRLWHDQLHPGAHFEIWTVDPPVPPLPGWENHLGDVIVLQSPSPQRRATLVSTLLQEPSIDRRSLTAFSVPLDQPRHELIRIAGLMFPSWHHPCTIHRGERELRDGRIRHLQGSGIFIQVVPEVDELTLMQQPIWPHASPAETLRPSDHTLSWQSSVFDTWVSSAFASPDDRVVIETWFIHTMISIDIVSFRERGQLVSPC